MVDELHRQHDEALVLRTAKSLIARKEELREFRGERRWRAVVELVRRIVDDAGLGRVGNDVLQCLAFCEPHEALVVAVGTQHLVNAGDDAVLLIGLTVLLAAQQHRVEVLLLVEALVAFLRARHDDGHASIEALFLVCDVDGIVHESAQEVALADLQHLHRVLLRRI